VSIGSVEFFRLLIAFGNDPSLSNRLEVANFVDAHIDALLVPVSAQQGAADAAGICEEVERDCIGEREKQVARECARRIRAAKAPAAQAMPGDWTVEWESFSSPTMIRLNSPTWGGCFLPKPPPGDITLASIFYYLLADMLAASPASTPEAAPEQINESTIRSIVTKAREFYLGYLSRHIPCDDIDAVRAAVTTDTATRAIAFDLRATQQEGGK
jgi:hypothetical protein